MKPRYTLLLVGLLVAPLAAAQQVDTIIVRGLAAPLFRSEPPGAGIDEEIIIRPSDGAVYFIRRYGLEGDSVHAFIRQLPEGQRFRLHADPLRMRLDSLGIDPLTRFDADSLARFRVWSDSMRHLFRLHADSLRLDGPVRLFERRPGARVEWERDVDVFAEGDSAVIRVRRGPGAVQRFVVPRTERLRPETRPDGVLVVPDGKGGTWVYLPPKAGEE